MSNISTVYNAILTRLGFIYSSNTSYTRIPDPYELENNKEIFLRKGYGLKYNGASPVEGELNQYNNVHSFSIVLSRENIKLESQFTPVDDVTKNILEDVYRLQQDFYASNELNAQSSINIIDLGDVTPITTVFGDKDKYKTTEIFFNLNICESF